MFKRSSAARGSQKPTTHQAHVDFEELSRQTGVSVDELRTLASSSNQADEPLLTANKSTRSPDQFEADYARLQSPAYQRLARKAEQSVVGKHGFRRFGEKR